MDIVVQNAILDLILGIKDNNLEQVKLNVDILNNNKDVLADEGYTYLDGTLSLGEISQKYNNESLLYVLDNLTLLNNAERIKWNLTVRDLMKNRNISDIQNFINVAINNGNITNYKFYSLIQLATNIQDYDLIYTLKQFLNKGDV